MEKILLNDLNEIINSNIIDWNVFDNKNIFITGSTGLIGSIITKTFLLRNELYNSNINLYLLVRNRKKTEAVFGDNEHIKIIESSIEDYNPEYLNIDYIIHAASPTKSRFFVDNPVETLNTAVFGTKNMLELAKINNVSSMIYLSSMEMYGILDSDNVAENDLGYINPLNVRSSYSEGKRICELYCYSYMKEYNVPVKIGRIAQTFGPGIPKDENRVYKSFVDSILEKKNIVLKSSGSTIINYSYTTDTVLGLLCVLLKGLNGEAYNIVGDKTNMTILDSALWLSKEYGNDEIEVEINIPTENTGFAPDNYMVLSNEKIKKLGWYPKHDIKYGYNNLINYIKDEKDK